MHSSPATPTGTICWFSSSTTNCVSPIPAPRRIFLLPLSTFHNPDQIVVSVGPYRFHTSALLAVSSFANSTLSASPPHSTFSSGTPSHPPLISICHPAGVHCITVPPLSFSNRVNRSPSRLSSLVLSTNRAPVTSGSSISIAAMSKLIVVTPTSTSSLLSPGLCLISLRKWLSAPCLTPTPLGLPVDPEV